MKMRETLPIVTCVWAATESITGSCLYFLVYQSVGSFEPIFLCKRIISHAGTIVWGYKMVLTLAVILTLLNFILLLALILLDIL